MSVFDMSYTLNTNAQTETVYLDSTNCNQRKPYFRYQLNTAISCPPSMRILLSVQQATFPNVIQNVNQFNNTLSYNYNGSMSTHVFPVGIYSAWSWCDYFNTISPGLIACTYKDFYFTFFSSYSFSLINTAVNPTTCGALIGVGKSDVDNTFMFPVTATVPYFTLKMPSTVNFVSPYIFLKMADLILSNINSFGDASNCLLRIPVNAPYGELVQYRPTEVNRFLLSENYINFIQFKLEDHYNRPLDLPTGAELQVVLKIEFVYPAENLPFDMGTMEHDRRVKDLPETPVARDEGL